MKKLFEKYREVIVYLIVGGLTTGVSWAVYALCVRVFGWSVGVSNAVSWIAAVTFAFVTNKTWVFQSRSWEPRLVKEEAVKFLGARALTGVLELVGVPGLVKLGLDQTILGVDGALSKVIVTVAVIILNYVFSKLFIFNKKT